jgi:sulfate transport system permease protein
VGSALLWLTAVLALPFASVFAAAFSEGFGTFARALADPAAIHAAWLTFVAVVSALAFNLVFGIAAAYTIERTTLPGRRVISTLLDLPIAVSPVVAGLMFLLLFGRQGWLGKVLESLDIQIVFALPGIVLATIFVTLPFVAKEVSAVLREMGTAEEEAAATLGASPAQTFLHVVLPSIRWALFYGSVLTAARALGEFGAVSVLSGNLIGRTQTLPLFIEQAYVNYQTTTAFALAVPLTLLAVLTIAAQKVLEWLSSRERGRAASEETS